jgi:hypothetical protein
MHCPYPTLQRIQKMMVPHVLYTQAREDARGFARWHHSVRKNVYLL